MAKKQEVEEEERRQLQSDLRFLQTQKASLEFTIE